MIAEDGRFVADRPGNYTIASSSGGRSVARTVHIVPRDIRRHVELVGHGPVRDRFTSDLWVWEAPTGAITAMTGTYQAEGHAFFWDVTDPSDMRIVDVVLVDARTVNDLKVSEDGRIAVISREGASNRRNGLVVLDVSNPTDGVRVLSRFDDQLTGGVHNVFIYDSHVYALSAGAATTSSTSKTRPTHIASVASSWIPPRTRSTTCGWRKASPTRPTGWMVSSPSMSVAAAGVGRHAIRSCSAATPIRVAGTTRPSPTTASPPGSAM